MRKFIRKSMRKKLAIVTLFASVLSSKTSFANEKQHDTKTISDSNISQNKNINEIQTKSLPIGIAAGVILTGIIGIAGMTAFLIRSFEERSMVEKCNNCRKAVIQAFTSIPSENYDECRGENFANEEILKKFTPEIKSQIIDVLPIGISTGEAYIYIYKVSSYLKSREKFNKYEFHSSSEETYLCFNFGDFRGNFTVKDDNSIEVSLYKYSEINSRYFKSYICHFKLKNARNN